MRLTKKVLIVLVLISATICLHYFYKMRRLRFNYSQLMKNEDLLDVHPVENRDRNRSPEARKLILFWTGGNSKTFYFNIGTGSQPFSKCQVSKCFATLDKRLVPVEQYDAIMFYVATSPDHPEEVIPPKRSPHQRYVFGNFETPIRFNDNTTQYMFDDFYNWTMTYRLDSDLPRRHGYVIEDPKKSFRMPSVDFVKNKKRTAAWFVSNCNNSFNKREKLAKELQKYIDVDIYGRCGNLTCPKTKDCLGMAEKRYKFYLSFENSHCKDYTTEKLFKTLTKNIIPVVYGGGNYSQVAPPHSYINVHDFDSVESLANYLKMLANHPEKYLEYFEWRKTHTVIQNSASVLCKLCKMLNDPNQPRKTYVDIRHWWMSPENSQCLTEKTLPKIVSNLR